MAPTRQEWDYWLEQQDKRRWTVCKIQPCLLWCMRAPWCSLETVTTLLDVACPHRRKKNRLWFPRNDAPEHVGIQTRIGSSFANTIPGLFSSCIRTACRLTRLVDDHRLDTIQGLILLDSTHGGDRAAASLSANINGLLWLKLMDLLMPVFSINPQIISPQKFRHSFGRKCCR